MPIVTDEKIELKEHKRLAQVNPLVTNRSQAPPWGEVRSYSQSRTSPLPKEDVSWLSYLLRSVKGGWSVALP